jgi:hypothetical protein
MTYEDAVNRMRAEIAQHLHAPETHRVVDAVLDLAHAAGITGPKLAAVAALYLSRMCAEMNDSTAAELLIEATADCAAIDALGATTLARVPVAGSA